jgi:protein-tyrosine phosphatase
MLSNGVNLLRGTVKMIDLHSHILFGIDDGPKAIEESIQMCRIGYQDGIRTIVATPHILPGIYQNNRSTILTKLQQLNNALMKFGVQSSEFVVQNFNASTPQRLNVNSKNSINPTNSINPINPITQLPNDPMTGFKLLPGADVHFSSDVLQRYEEGEIVTVNDQGRYLMVEFAFQGIPYQAEEVLFKLLTKGITPIISHPERNMEIAQRPKRYYEMIRMGCLGQVTAMSLTGDFGSGVRRIAEKLLSKRLIHMIASDAHSADGRPPILSAAVKAAEKIVGKEEAQKMVTEYPQAVIDGRRPNIPEPLSP